MHGDISDIKAGRYGDCACTSCTETRNFLEFRDLAEAPPRPAKIDTRFEAAAFFRWYAAQLAEMLDEVEGDRD
jgi:hypothetical protein